MARTAAALLIGNELLSGKVQDRNLSFLGQQLFAMGIALERVVICMDDVDTIARELSALRTAHDFVFTSGGIGPTHDDVTLAGVAQALGKKLVRSPELRDLISNTFGGAVLETHLTMADVPEGAELLRSPEVRWPTVMADNIIVLPGVPEIFERKFACVRSSLTGGAPFVTRTVRTQCDEFDIADMLEALAKAYPEVTFGSYPQWRDPDCQVKLTVDGTNAQAVEQAHQALLAKIPADKLVADKLVNDS